MRKKGKKKKKNTIVLDESFEFEKENIKNMIHHMKNKHKNYEGVESVLSCYFLPKNNSIRLFCYKL